MNIDKYRKQEILTVIAYALSSLSFILFYFADYQKNGFTKVLGYLLPSVFWAGLVIGVIMQVVISVKLKGKANNRVGIISFFKNKYALIFDILMIISFIVTLILMILKINNFAAFLAISLMIFSFELHCVFNGKYFNYILTKEDNKNE